MFIGNIFLYSDNILRNNKQQTERNNCTLHRRNLKAIQGILNGQPTPVPTQPIRPRKPIAPKNFLKTKSVAFVGVSRKKKVTLCKDFGVEIFRGV